MERHEVLAMMTALKLAGMRTAYDDILADGLKRRHPVQQIIGALLKAEIADKTARSIKYQMASAKLPAARELAEFDFAASPVNEPLIRDLAMGGFFEAKRNIVLVGDKLLGLDEQGCSGGLCGGGVQGEIARIRRRSILASAGSGSGGADVIAVQQRQLGQNEQEGQPHDAEHLEAYPEIGALGTPDRFVEERHRDEENSEAEGEPAPAFVVHLPGRAEDRLEEGTPEGEPAQQYGRDQPLHDGRLELDEGLVVEPEGEAAEDADHASGDQRHQRHPLADGVGKRERGRGGDHQCGGRGDQVEEDIGTRCFVRTGPSPLLARYPPKVRPGHTNRNF